MVIGYLLKGTIAEMVFELNWFLGLYKLFPEKFSTVVPSYKVYKFIFCDRKIYKSPGLTLAHALFLVIFKLLHLV